jgi:hypothetical protein
MNELSIEEQYRMDEQEQELLKFECWYHSVIDDMTSLVCVNGYEQVMYDVMCAVQRCNRDKRLKEGKQ